MKLFTPNILQDFQNFICTDVGQVLLDTFRFFFVYLVIAVVVYGLFMAQVYWLLHIQDDMKSPGIDLYGFEVLSSETHYDRISYNLMNIAKYSGFIPMLLASFAVFFTLPPKKFRHVLFVTFFIFMPVIPFVIPDHVLEMLSDFFSFSLLTFGVWLSSLLSFRCFKRQKTVS